MTEYELGDLFLNTALGAGSLFMTLVTVMAGFLFVGLYFGQMLDRVMTGIIVAGYTIIFATSDMQINRAYTTFVNLGEEIRRRAESGDEFQWHAVLTAPEWIFSVSPYLASGLLVLGYVGTLVFFFRTRKLDPREFR